MPPHRRHLMPCPPRMALQMVSRPGKVQSKLLSTTLRPFSPTQVIPGRRAAQVPFHPRRSRQCRRHHPTLYSRHLASATASGCKLLICSCPASGYLLCAKTMLIAPRALIRSRNPENLSGFTHQSRVSKCFCAGCIIIHQVTKSRITTSALVHGGHNKRRA